MFDIDNDMDDLLRRAAENYPLKNPEDKWDEIAARLQNEPVKRIATLHTGLIPGILLLLVMLFSKFTADLNLFVNRSSNSPVINHSSMMHDMVKGKSNAATTALTKHIEHTSKQLPFNVYYNNSLRKTDPAGNLYGNVNYSIGRVLKRIKNDEDVVESPELNNNLNFGESISAAKTNEKIIPLKDNSVRNDTTGNSITSKDNHKKQNHLYAGIGVAASISTIKSRETEKPGFGFGLLAGYTINKRWSAETGIFYSKKMYKSEGKYFDTKAMKSTMPSGMELKDMTGTSHIVEIPLQVKYNFGKGSRHLFSTAGISTYMVILEKNEYNMMDNGVASKMNGSYSDKNTLFAGFLNLSAGYEIPAGKLRIRFEPFTQIPLKGIGIGKLPLTSFGFRIAFIR